MSANDQQVGGSHYKTSYEHWDFVLATGMGYLEGNATKYVARWRKKGGIADLRKALHYLNKLDENCVRASYISVRIPHSVALATVERFARANMLTSLERTFCECLATRLSADGLVAARESLFRIMDEAEEQLPAARPVPLKEENHHAQRDGQADEDYLGV